MLPLPVIYANNDAQIAVDEPNKYLQVSWLQHPSSESFRNIITYALNYAQVHRITLWLCDMRQIIYLELKDQHWLIQEVFPTFSPTEKHEFAYVVSTKGLEIYTSFHIHELVLRNGNLRQKIQIEIFFEKDIARQWLLDRKKSGPYLGLI
jgi:hypothetical protein